MTQDKSNDILKSVLEKRRNCIPLNSEEQKYVDETYGRLFEKKFGNRTFVTKTGEQMRKDAISTKEKEQKVGAEKEKPLAEERSKPAESQKIKNDDPSGTVKATETGDMVNVDEKKTGTEAEHVNASDMTHADNTDEQRKPVMKFVAGDVVIKSINGKNIAGIILKYADKEKLAFVKWASGTFSYVHVQELVKLADALLNLSKEDKPLDEKEEIVMTPEAEAKPPVEDAEEETEIEKAPVVGTTAQDKPAADAKPVEGTPAEEAKETPAQEAVEPKAEEAKEQATDTEAKPEDKPAEDNLAENEWFARCEKSVGANGNVTDANTICRFVRTTMKKSTEKIVKMDREEIRKSNPKLAEQMEKDGHKELNFDTEVFDKDKK